MMQTEVFDSCIGFYKYAVQAPTRFSFIITKAPLFIDMTCFIFEANLIFYFHLLLLSPLIGLQHPWFSAIYLLLHSPILNHHDIKICSLNVRGLRNKKKRDKMFCWLKDQSYNIILLQETHSTSDIIDSWTAEWGNKAFLVELKVIVQAYVYMIY